MKYVLLFLILFTMGCGTLVFKSDRVVYKNGKLSCTQLRCCYPYGEKIMICNQGTVNGDGIFIRYYFDK